MSLLLKLFLFPWELDSMPEYSMSLPTGTTIGKVWRRRQHGAPSEWIVGMYVPHRNPKTVGIIWFDVELRHGPAPHGYQTPDWINYANYKRLGAE